MLGWRYGALEKHFPRRVVEPLLTDEPLEIRDIEMPTGVTAVQDGNVLRLTSALGSNVLNLRALDGNGVGGIKVEESRIRVCRCVLAAVLGIRGGWGEVGSFVGGFLGITIGDWGCGLVWWKGLASWLAQNFFVELIVLRTAFGCPIITSLFRVHYLEQINFSGRLFKGLGFRVWFESLSSSCRIFLAAYFQSSRSGYGKVGYYLVGVSCALY